MNYSVIIPCFNAEKFIDHALNSVLKQSVFPKEIILVDNMSTDNTLEKIKYYASNYSFVKFLVENNKGVSYARNAGLNIASGDYIQFLDVDDYLNDDKVKLQLELIQNENTTIDILFDNYFIEELNGERELIKNEMNDLWLGLLKGKLGFTSSNLWRREILLKIGGFDVSLVTSEEYHLIFEILKNKGSYLFAETSSTFKREINSNSLTKSEPKLNWLRYSKLRFEMIVYMESTEIVKNIHYVAFFDVLRILYPIKKELAVEYYNLILKNKFLLEETETSSRMYVFLYKMLGFKWAEFLKKVFQ